MPRPVSSVALDAALVGAAAALTAFGQPEAALAVAGLGLLGPVGRFRTRRRGVQPLLAHVPAEIAVGYRSVVIAAARPGVVDGRGAVVAAERIVVDVASVVGGRDAKGRTRRRLVERQVTVLRSIATDLNDRHQAWREAAAEVEALDPTDAIAADPPARPLSVWVAMVVCFPLFAVADAVRALVLMLVGLPAALWLRVSAVAGALLRPVGRAAAGVARSVAEAARSWRTVRDESVAAVREARVRFLALRVGRALR